MKYMNMFVYMILFTVLTTWLLSCSKSMDQLDVQDAAALQVSSATHTLPVSETILRELSDSIAILDTEYRTNNSLSIGARRELKIHIDENKNKLVELAQVYVDTKELHVQNLESELERFTAGGASETAITKAKIAANTAQRELENAEALVYELTGGIIGDINSSNANSQIPNSSSSISPPTQSSIGNESSSASSESAVPYSLPNSSSSSSSSSSSIQILSSSELASTESSTPYSSKVSSSEILKVSSSKLISSATTLSSSSKHISSATPVSSSTKLSSSSSKIVVPVPNIKGTLTFSGLLAKGKIITASGKECTAFEPEVPELKYTWYIDDDAKGFNGVALADDTSKVKLLPEHVGEYLYVITTCSDTTGRVVIDTSDYSTVIRDRYTLTINSVTGGTIDGESTFLFTEGETRSISVTMDPGYSFKKWKVISGPGTIVFHDTTSHKTAFNLFGGDAVIEPIFTMDTEKPTAPKNVTTSQGSTNNTSLTLSWSASTDNKGVVGYTVYINGEVFYSTAKRSLIIATKHFGFSKIWVRAFDAAGNESPKSKYIYHIELEDADRNERITFKGTGYKYAGGLSNNNERLYFDKRTVSAGKYKMKIRYADAINNTINEFQLIWSEPSSAFKDKIMTQVYTGGWEKWTTLSTGSFNLAAGTGTLRFQFIGKDFNTDWVELIEQ